MIYINRESILSKKESKKEDFNRERCKKESKKEDKIFEYSNSYTDYNQKTNTYTSNYGSTREDNSSYLNKLLSEVTSDFIKYPYNDKFDISDIIYVGYRFENNRKIIIDKHMRLVDNSYNYTTRVLTSNEVYKIVSYFKELAKIGVLRNTSKNFDYFQSDNFKRWSNYNSQNNKSDFYTKKEDINYTDEQLKNQKKFWKLKQNNDTRLEQFKKLASNDPDKEALRNEINAVKRKMKIFFDKSGLTIKKK